MIKKDFIFIMIGSFCIIYAITLFVFYISNENIEKRLNNLSNEILTNQISIIDTNGKVRQKLHIDNNIPSLDFYNESGEIISHLGTDQLILQKRNTIVLNPVEAGITISNEDNEVIISPTDIAISNKHTTEKILLSLKEEGGVISLQVNDKKGKSVKITNNKITILDQSSPILHSVLTDTYLSISTKSEDGTHRNTRLGKIIDIGNNHDGLYVTSSDYKINEKIGGIINIIDNDNNAIIGITDLNSNFRFGGVVPSGIMKPVLFKLANTEIIR